MRKFFSVLGYFLFIGAAAYAYIQYDSAHEAARPTKPGPPRSAVVRPTLSDVEIVKPVAAIIKQPDVPMRIIKTGNHFLISQNAPASRNEVDPFAPNVAVEPSVQHKDSSDPFAPSLSETVPVPRDSPKAEPPRDSVRDFEVVTDDARASRPVEATPDPQPEESAIREKNAQINKMKEARGRLQQAQLGDMVHEVDARIGQLENEIKQLSAALEMKRAALKEMQAAKIARSALRNRDLREQQAGPWNEVLREVRQLRGEVAEIRKDIGELRGSLKGAAVSRPGMRIVTEEIMKDGNPVRIQRVVPTQPVGPELDPPQRDAAGPGGGAAPREVVETAIIDGKPVVVRRQIDGSGQRIRLETTPPQEFSVRPRVPDATAPTYQPVPPTSVEPGPPSSYESPDAFRKEPARPAAPVELQAKPEAPPSIMQRLTGSEPQPGTYKLTIVRSSHGPAGQEPELTLTLEDPVHSLRKLTVDNLESWLGSMVQNAADKEVLKKSRMEIHVAGDTLGKQVLQLVQIVNKSGFGQVKVSYPPSEKKKPAEGDVSFATPNTPSVETTRVVPLPKVIESFDEPSAVDRTVDVFLGPATEPAAPISPSPASTIPVPATTSLAPATPLAEDVQPVTSQPKVSVKVTSHVDEKTKKTSYQVFFVNSLTKTINGHDVVEQRSEKPVTIDKASEVFTKLAAEYREKCDLKTIVVSFVVDKNLPQLQFMKLIEMANKAGFGQVKIKPVEASSEAAPGTIPSESATSTSGDH